MSSGKAAGSAQAVAAQLKQLYQDVAASNLSMGEKAEAIALLAALEQYGDPEYLRKTLLGIQMKGGAAAFFKQPSGPAWNAMIDTNNELYEDLIDRLEQNKKEIAKIPIWERIFSNAEYKELQSQKIELEEQIMVVDKRLNQPGWNVLTFWDWSEVEDWEQAQLAEAEKVAEEEAKAEAEAEAEEQKVEEGQPVQQGPRPILDPQKRYSASKEIKELMKQREGGISYLKATGIGVFNKQGDLIGIYPHYVGDGGITLGYGHYIREAYLHDQSYETLLRKYVPNKNTPMNGKGGMVVPGSKYMKLEDALSLFEEDIKKHEDALNYYLKEAGIPITSNEFDALILVRFNDGSVPKAFDLLENGIRDRSAWEEIWPSSDKRLELALRIFFDNNYDMQD